MICTPSRPAAACRFPTGKASRPSTRPITSASGTPPASRREGAGRPRAGAGDRAGSLPGRRIRCVALRGAGDQERRCQSLRAGRCRLQRADAPGHVRQLPRDERDARPTASSAPAGLRWWPGRCASRAMCSPRRMAAWCSARAAAGPGGRSAGDPRHRRLRRLDVQQLQQPAADRRGAGRWRHRKADPPAPDGRGLAGLGVLSCCYRTIVSR